MNNKSETPLKNRYIRLLKTLGQNKQVKNGFRFSGLHYFLNVNGNLWIRFIPFQSNYYCKSFVQLSALKYNRTVYTTDSKWAIHSKLLNYFEITKPFSVNCSTTNRGMHFVFPLCGWKTPMWFYILKFSWVLNWW